MKIFKLPDLGEGLPDAIIREWHIKAGDHVTKDQPLVSMETAKALVEVPAPFDGVIEKLFGQADDVIATGAPLIGFQGTHDTTDEKQDTGTVVGKIEQTNKILQEKKRTIRTNSQTITPSIKATPAVRALARKLGVDLSTVSNNGRVTAEAVKAAAKLQPVISTSHPHLNSADWTPISHVKRAMVMRMQESHQQIVPVTLIDDADIHAWNNKQDITVRIMRAIIQACKTEPALNAHFDGNELRIQHYDHIHLGLAIDMPHGLYVPVLKNIETYSDDALRKQIEQFKQQAKTKSISQDNLHGATIVLSNFGAIAGRYANPIILPPTVAIIGIGRIQKTVVADANDQPSVHRIIPISLTIDHRAITGGEAARFLNAMMLSLAKETAS